jgi:hypothetical protein
MDSKTHDINEYSDEEMEETQKAPEKKKYKNVNGVDKKREIALKNLAKARATRSANSKKALKNKPKYELRNDSDSDSDSDDELLVDIMNKRSQPKHKKQEDNRIGNLERMMQDMYQLQIKQAKKLKKERRQNEKIVLLPPTQEIKPVAKEKQAAALSIQDQIKREWFLS